MIPLPQARHPMRNGSVHLEWKHTDYPNGVNDGSYYVRGAVCWPMLQADGESRGHAICAIQRISNGRIIVVADTRFSCIDNIVEDSKIVATGLSKWFTAVWAAYACDTFWWSGSDKTHRQYLIETVRSDSIQPKPWFPEVEISDSDDAVATLFNYKTRGMLIIDDESNIVKDILMWQQAGMPKTMPSVIALSTLAVGYSRFPFRSGVEE